MRIVVVTQKAPMYLPTFLDEFFSELSKTEHIVDSIVMLSPYFKGSVWREIKDRYDYYGFLDFTKMLLYIFLNKCKSYVFYLFPNIGCYSVDNVKKKYKTKECKIKFINSKDFENYIRVNKVDLVISIASPQIFKNNILNSPKYGCINYHTSVLPKYRGRQPLFWALFNDEKEVGITIHEMDDKLDNGLIILQEKLKILSKDTLHSLYLKTIKVGPRLMVKAIKKLESGSAERVCNNAALATYYHFPTKKDAAFFKAKGKRFF